jgi:hypothetical protein
VDEAAQLETVTETLRTLGAAQVSQVEAAP